MWYIGWSACHKRLLVRFIFTPTVVAQTVDHWFGVEVCYMHYHDYHYMMINAIFSYNLIFVLTLMSCERFWAICKPWHYHKWATQKLILIAVAILVAICGSLITIPTFLIPISLHPGWYCDIENCTANEVFEKSMEICLTVEYVGVHWSFEGHVIIWWYGLWDRKWPIMIIVKRRKN